MAELVNLRAARKHKARIDKEARAEQNRLLFGRTKAERLSQAAEKARAEKRIEGHKLGE